MERRIDFPAEALSRSIAQRFLAVAMEVGDGPAAYLNDVTISYRHLASQVCSLAAAIAREASPNQSSTPIAIVARDPLSLITGMLATWAAGYPCVAMADDLPPTRLQALFQQATATIAVADAAGARAVASAVPHATVVPLIHPSRSAIEPRSVAAVGGDDPACLIFTSGSTGVPKGVVRSHSSLLARARHLSNGFGIRTDDRGPVMHSPTTTAGVRDFLTLLLSGGAAVPLDLRRTAVPDALDLLGRTRVTVVSAVASTLRHLMADSRAVAAFKDVRAVRAGAEPFYRHDVERFRATFPPTCTLTTTYGSTESGGIAEFVLRPGSPAPDGRLPAGFPLPGVEITIQDDDGHRVADGVAGQVVVRSPHLSSGYWRLASLTDEKFRRGDGGKALEYRTGDVGRTLSDGSLMLEGRADGLVKLRGHRVDVDEIASVVSTHPDVRAAAVATSGVDAELRLVAYVVAREPIPSAGALRAFILERLPAHMVPAQFVFVHALPLLASGKLDRRSLPAPPPIVSRADPVERPHNPFEHQLIEIWEQVLGTSPIGRSDDFFELGGDSFAAAAIAKRVETICGRTVPPAVLLTAPTVSALATALLAEEAPLVAMVSAVRPGGTATPLVFVHNDHGRGLYTHGLVNALPEGRPVLTVHLHALAGPPPPPNVTVEEIARARVGALRELRPHGPYAIGGHCNGGMVAIEMARLLHRLGERVSLILVDTRAPGARRVARWSQAARLGSVVVGRAIAERLASAVDHAIILGASELSRLSLARRIAGPHLAAWTHRRDEGRTSGRRYQRALRRHFPAPFDVPTTVLRATDFDPHRPDLGWPGFFPNVTVEEIPGDHHSSITRHVRDLAAHIERAIQRTEASGGR